jgi:translocation and assembly module TamA
VSSSAGIGRAARAGLRVRAFVATLLALGCLLATGVVGAASDQARYEVTVDAPGTLKALVEGNLSLIRWRDADGRRGRIDADQLRRLFDQGRDEIARLVATEGYYTPTIDAELTEDGDHWVAHYRIEPNAVTRVESVDLQFVGPVKDAPADRPPDVKALQDGWTLGAGDVFLQADWEANKRKLLQGFLIRTYPFATMTRSEATVDVRTSKAKLVVVIASGPAVRFGPLQVTGLQRYPNETVRNLDPMDLGELYSQQKLFDFQQKLASSGYFARTEVSVNTEADPGTDPRSPFVAPKAADGETPATPATADAPETPLPREVTLPVRVFVEENKSKQISVGLGVASNTGPHASLSYNIINFLGGAKQLRTNLAFDQLNQTVGADLVFPTTPRGDRYSISSAITRTNVQNEITRGATVSGKRVWGPETTERFSSIDYTIENKTLSDVPETQAQVLGVTHGVTLRRTDNLLAPTTGYMVTAQAGAGIRLTNGKPYGRVYGKGIRYLPLGENNTIIGRVEIGAVAGGDTISLPSTLLFRAGGDGSVRGYGYQSLGVRQEGAVVGGRYIATGSLEIDHWLAPRWPQWGVAAFVDAGNAGNQFANLSPVEGYGVGGRWRSPVGTLDLDVARGVQNGTIRLHFSLGVTF